LLKPNAVIADIINPLIQILLDVVNVDSFAVLRKCLKRSFGP